MVYQQNNDEYDFFSGDFAPDEPPHPNDEGYQYQPFNPISTTANSPAGPTSSGTLVNGDPSIGSSLPFLLSGNYDVHFGALPQAAQPPSLALEDIINIFAFGSEDSTSQGPDTPAPEQAGSARTTGLGPVPITTSYPSHNPFTGSLMSTSLPETLRGIQAPMYSDANRSRSRSYAGQTLAPYNQSIPPSAFHTPPSLAPNGTFQVEFQDTARGPPMMLSPLAGPTEQVLNFDSGSHRNEHSDHPPTILPSSIPLPGSPSDDSSFASSPTLSPATSTSSLAGPPSPGPYRTETFRWRLNSQDDQDWRCECESKAKKRKRHLESCPNNPNKPRIICPHCPQPFTGGSRKSALSKHLANIHGQKPAGKKKDKRR